MIQMLLKILVIIILVITSVTMTTLVIFGSMNYAGVCLSEGKILTDKEKVEAAINGINASSQVIIDIQKKGTQFYKRIPYKNKQEFLEKNIDCCALGKGRDVPPTTLWKKIEGENVDTIKIKYKAMYLDENGNIKVHVKSNDYILTNCGKLR